MSVNDQELKAVAEGTFSLLARVIEKHKPELRAREVGRICSVSHGIARVEGLPGVRAEELVQFPGGLLGLAFNIDVSEVGVILLDEAENLGADAEVRRTGRVLDVPVGEALLGRVVDALGVH